jgi:hypothetical protein
MQDTRELPHQLMVSVNNINILISRDWCSDTAWLDARAVCLAWEGHWNVPLSKPYTNGTDTFVLFKLLISLQLFIYFCFRLKNDKKKK